MQADQLNERSDISPGQGAYTTHTHHTTPEQPTDIIRTFKGSKQQ